MAGKRAYSILMNKMYTTTIFLDVISAVTVSSRDKLQL